MDSKGSGGLSSFVREAISSLKDLLRKGFWEKSFMMKRQKKKIEDNLSEVESSISRLERSVATRDDICVKEVKEHTLTENEEYLYIVVYQASGRNMLKWQVTLNAVDKMGFGRPVYTSEKDARQAVKNKGENETDGYIIVYVDKSRIVKGQSLTDSNGMQLVNIKPGSLTVKNIVLFVHYNTDRLYYIDGKFVLANKKSPTDNNSSQDKVPDKEGSSTQKDFKEDSHGGENIVDSSINNARNEAGQIQDKGEKESLSSSISMQEQVSKEVDVEKNVVEKAVLEDKSAVAPAVENTSKEVDGEARSNVSLVESEDRKEVLLNTETIQNNPSEEEVSVKNSVKEEVLSNKSSQDLPAKDVHKEKSGADKEIDNKIDS